MTDRIDDHDQGLAHDLEVISHQMIARRRMLAWFATAGAGALVGGCGDAVGRYLLYTVPAESYLRGVQVSDVTGR